MPTKGLGTSPQQQMDPFRATTLIFEGKTPGKVSDTKKEIEEETNKWKHVQCSWTGSINTFKMSIAPQIISFNQIPIKMPMPSFTEVEQLIQSFIWTHKRPWIIRHSS